MNSLTVIQASQGLAAYVLENVPLAASKGVVIGRDARHNSEKFAKHAAAAFVAKGMKVWWYEGHVHTPLVPFGVFELGAAIGVMIRHDGIRIRQKTMVRAICVGHDHFTNSSRL